MKKFILSLIIFIFLSMVLAITAQLFVDKFEYNWQAILIYYLTFLLSAGILIKHSISKYNKNLFVITPLFYLFYPLLLLNPKTNIIKDTLLSYFLLFSIIFEGYRLFKSKNKAI